MSDGARVGAGRERGGGRADKLITLWLRVCVVGVFVSEEHAPRCGRSRHVVFPTKCSCLMVCISPCM